MKSKPTYYTRHLGISTTHFESRISSAAHLSLDRSGKSLTTQACNHLRLQLGRLVVGVAGAGMMLASSVQAGTNVLIADDFNNNSIDGGKWVTLNPNGNATNGETAQPNGYIFSKNRATINTVTGVSWDPVNATYGGQHLTGVFYMAADSNRSQGDNVEIMTRSNNQNNGGNTVAAKYGISFSIGEGGNVPNLGITGYTANTWSVGPTQIGTMFSGAANITTNNNYQTPISFDIWDFGDGRYIGTYTNMTHNTGSTSAGFTASVMGTATVTGSFSAPIAQVNQINIHCRERSNGNVNQHQSNFDDLVISAPSSWSGAGDGTWSGANWSGGNGVTSPSGNGTSVIFGKPSTGAAVDLNVASTLGAIAFYPDVNTIVSTNNGSSLTLDNRPTLASSFAGGSVDTGALAGITVLGGTHVINPNIAMTNSATIVVFGVGDTLTLGGSISGSGYNSLYTANLSTSTLIGGNVLTGNSLTKGGAGTLVLSGANTFGGFTRATLGTLTVANPLALQNSTVEMNTGFTGSIRFDSGITAATFGGLTGGKNFSLVNLDTDGVTLTVGKNTANTTYSGSLDETGSISPGGLTKVGTGTLTLTGNSTYSGATTVSKGILKLDFSAAISLTDLVGITSPLVLAGGTLNVTGKSSTIDSQTVASLAVNPGASAVFLNGNSATSLLLALNGISHTAGGIVDFTLPIGVQNASNGITTSSSNDASGIIGAWATVGGSDFATVSSGNIIAYTGYADVTRFSSGPQVIANGATTNVRIVEGTGSAADITLGAATTTINTLTQSTNGGVSAAVIDPAGQTLVVNGILVAAGAGGLTIGSGTLKNAGTELIINNSAATAINSVIVNGSGASTLNKTGSGVLQLNGINTYSGDTIVNGGSLTLANDAGLKFVVTNSTSNKVTGAGAAAFSGDFTIDTSAVSNPTGSWTLVDVASKTFDSDPSHFTVVGFTANVDGVTWTKVAGPLLWTFSETSGVLTLGASSTPYEDWALDKGLTGANDGPEDDPDRDGEFNIVEFGFNGDPLDGSDNGLVYELTEDSDVAGDPSSAKELILTVAVRKTTAFTAGAPATSALIDGIIYSIEGGTTLNGFPGTVKLVPTVLLPAGAPDLTGSDYEYRSFTLDGSNGLPNKGFLRGKVTKP